MSCGTWISWTLLVLLSSVCLQPRPGLAEPVVIKFATLAPEGTPWMNIMEEMNREVQEKSGGQVAFRFYAGGVAGDERDVIDIERRERSPRDILDPESVEVRLVRDAEARKGNRDLLPRVELRCVK